jgi:hypothetical protein
MVCPRCHADRLIPLSYSATERQGSVAVLLRPFAKCAGCGVRIYARIVARTPLPLDPDLDPL